MQTLINKILFCFFVLSSTAFSCAICTVYSPETKFYVQLDASNTKIKSAKVTWVLTKEFTDSLKEVYDKNANNFFDKDELELIAQTIYEYVIPRDYLAQITYSKTLDKNNFLPVSVSDKNVYIKNSILHFDYTIDLDYEIKNEYALYIKINDEENYFVLIHFDKLSKISEIKDVTTTKIATRDELIYNFAFNQNTIEKSKKQKEIEKIEQTNKQVQEQSLYEDQTSKEQDQTVLKEFVNKVKYYLVRIQNGDNLALLMLLLVSFVYGIIHALGPGHGKSLAFSYFMANKSSYTKAFFISQASAFVHIIGTLILVVISIFVLQSFLNNFVNDSVEILTKFSAILIVLLAIFILYQKLKNKGCACSSCCSSKASDSNSVWSTNKPKTTNSLKPNFMKQDLYFVLTAGIVPCPGTVVLFIYAFVLKTYFAVFLAAVAISFGMGLVTFASSFLGVSVKNLSEKSHKTTYALEILAPIVMLVLAGFLYFNAEVF